MVTAAVRLKMHCRYKPNHQRHFQNKTFFFCSVLHQPPQPLLLSSNQKMKNYSWFSCSKVLLRRFNSVSAALASY